MNGKKPDETKPKVKLTKSDVFVPKPWDPTKVRGTNSTASKKTSPSMTASLRVKKDLMSLYNDPPPGIFVVPTETDLMFMHAIIVGPMETPYEGGFFYFVLRCTEKYPIEPPLVKLMTTDAGKVRFNPNLYCNGKVCLSILGTWPGPAWSPAQQIGSVLISIQSLLNDKPYYNEPGICTERFPGECTHYNDIICHENLRVAVCGMLENECHLNIPPAFEKIMKDNFFAFFDQYESTCTQRLKLDGQTMRDPFCDKEERVFNFRGILDRLNVLKKKLTDEANDPEQKDSKSEDQPAGCNAMAAFKTGDVPKEPAKEESSTDDDDYLFDIEL